MVICLLDFVGILRKLSALCGIVFQLLLSKKHGGIYSNYKPDPGG